MTKKIEKILVANRGEIACRVFRTCRRLGIKTVAVYSSADAGALHVQMADESYLLGEPETHASYLNQDKIVEAARKTGADAIHPGYGFLSENAQFVERCEKEGLRFIGPSAKVVRLMGDKLQAKELAVKAGVPVVPGLTLEGGDIAKALPEVRKFAQKAKYPLIIKAAGGGGGRGMRKVYEESALADSVAGAAREAQSFFGDSRVFIEKLITKARHVEVQFFGDSHGDVTHIFDRDCSLQRNHQKVIEEAPAPGLSIVTKRAMWEAACRLGKAAGYTGAGTAEFLVDADGGFYFLEVNSRLQVEHPVTEEVSGLDLVEIQIRIAEGSALKDVIADPELHPEGAAIECRICAEAPEEGFVSSTGTIATFDFRSGGSVLREMPGVRLDTGFRAGDRVTHYYDSLLAKLIVHRETRREAIAAAIEALSSLRIFGVKSNLGFLLQLLRSSEFAGMQHDINFAETRIKDPASTRRTLALAAGLFLVTELRPRSENAGPWGLNTGWRLHGRGGHSGEVQIAGVKLRSSVVPEGPGVYLLQLDGGYSERIEILEWHCAGAMYSRGGVREYLSWQALAGDGTWLGTPFGSFEIKPLPQILKTHSDQTEHSANISSSLPGKIVDLKVETGQQVASGQTLVVIESMKMEHLIKAPRDGMVKKIATKRGQVVEANAVLIELEFA